MSMFAPLAQKEPRALERAEDELRAARARRTAYDAQRPSPEDPVALHTWKMKRIEFTLLVETHEEAVAFQRRRAEEAAVAAREAQAEEAHRSRQKEAKAHEKLVLEINDLNTKLAGKLTKLAEHKANLAAFNGNDRGDRPFIADAEQAVRLQPAIHRPARFEEREEWRDAEGRTPSQLIERNGKMVPHNSRGDYQLVKARVVVEPEVNESPRMPESFVNAIQLVDLAGKIIWPLRPL